MSGFAPIAIVGRACVFPGAMSPEALWERIVAGDDLTSDVPEGRWRVPTDAVLCTPDGDCTDRTWSLRGGYVTGFDDVFDPSGFALPAEEIDALDDVVRWTFHTARAALRDAGVDTATGSDVGRRIGAVFGNLSFPTDSMASVAQRIHLGDDDALDLAAGRNRFMSGLPALLLERALGLDRGAMALDAACASSLYAIKIACDRLHDGDADIMLAGAVNRADDLFIHQGFTALQALSPSGRSRPFHAEADGLVPGEGCGFLALKRLDDAERDGDTVHGIVRSVGLSNDGRGRGMLAPSSAGQVRAIASAFASCDVEPGDVSLLECHATGTVVGDAAELASSAEIYRDADGLAIGSLKSNTGHLITAAGVAGVIKVMEAMRHRTRPPTRSTESPSDAVRESPFRVVSEPEDWERPDGGTLVAGISAFGFGGNNAHLLLEAPRPPVERSTRAGAPDGATAASTQRVEPLAIVGIGITAARASGRTAFRDALLADEAQFDADGRATMSDIGLRLSVQRFPPNDLAAALPQQLAILQVADEAVEDAVSIPFGTTGVFVGMGTDPEAARYGTRWRLAETARHEGWDDAELERRRDAVVAPLTSAGVLGTMPNLVANRLNGQYDIGGPSFTVSSEEHSGLDALRLAARALRNGEIDAALVGAVDLSCEEVHRRSLDAVVAANDTGSERSRPGDAAVMLVVKRLADAERDGDRVYALVGEDATDGDVADPALPIADLDFGGGAHDAVGALFGRAHAAAGLVDVATAALLLHHRVTIGDRPLLPSGLPEEGVRLVGAGPRTATVHSVGLDGVVHRRIRLAEAGDHRSPNRSEAPRLHVFGGADRDAVVSALRRREPVSPGADDLSTGPARLVIVARDDDELGRRSDRAIDHLMTGAPAGAGVHFRSEPLDGEMAFVFAAGGAAYPSMGSELLRAMPEVVDAVSVALPTQRVVGWFGVSDIEPTAGDHLWGTALVSQAHVRVSRDLLGLHPDAAIGLSSGETNSLYALGAWTDLAAMVADIEGDRMLDREIAGEFAMVARAWGVDTVDWAVWNVHAPLDEMRELLAEYDRVHLMIIDTADDLVIGGDATQCREVVGRVGRRRCRSIAYNLACHVPELHDEYRRQWHDVHHRPVTPVDGVRFYSNGFGGAYEIGDDACAEAITRQAETTIDFPTTLRAAYDDGVRIFVEHGPGSACSNFVRSVLGDDVLAVHLDRRGHDIEQLFDVCAALVAAGIDVDHRALSKRLERREFEPGEPTGPVATFPAHRPPPLQETRSEAAQTAQTMPPAPTLPTVSGPAPASTIEPLQAPPVAPDLVESSVAGVVSGQLRSMAAMHQAFVDRQQEIHVRFLTDRAHSLTLLTGELRPEPNTTTSHLAIPVPTTPVPTTPVPTKRERDGDEQHPVGPTFDTNQLRVHSSGRISEIFGAAFEAQDGFQIQCRMPEPPLLLADRVTGLDAEPNVLGTGTIWTETDVEPDSWYLHDGRMPAGFMIESGQADLMLISWMGIDLIVQGERSYRLLGCTLTYHGDLPRVGETLRYEIRITGHARHGDIRLFFFEYDCIVDGERRLTVRDAQAGFFTTQELADALGALWTPEAAAADLDPDARVDPPAVICTKRRFSAEEVRAFAAGRVLECFGPGFELTETHTRTPTIQTGPQQFVDEITAFDASGGPWGRGFLRGESTIADDAWFFDGHFKNDPCMPGNFMVESCIQAMSIYLAALGHTVGRDGWRFQPLPGQPFDLKCRGEINPHTERVAYELYVEEVWDGPHPTVICDVLGFVDGKAAFHAHRIGVELVPAWPLESITEVFELTAPIPADARPATTDENGFAFDWPAMIACAWGRPSDAFGSMYADFDDTRRSPRLPGPPYHFISRVVQIDGRLDDLVAGLTIECEYDIPHDAWYFDSNGTETMPYAVLLEAALQPCGWVATAVGSTNRLDTDLLFRNLDGTGTLVDELTRTSGILTTRVELTSVSRAGSMIVEGFSVECRLGERVVYTMDTVFGFFPSEAFEDQAGLAVTDAHRTLNEEIEASDSEVIDLRERPERFCSGSPRLADERLLMIDRVRILAAAGRAGLGVVVGEKDVDVSEWFFSAHFFQDPVQPGSLGIEALLQLLQIALLDSEVDDVTGPGEAVFEPIMLGAPLTWRYRGQVTPAHSMITTVMEITEVGRDEVGPYVVGTGSLWCDGLRIYEVTQMGMRLRRTGASPDADAHAVPMSTHAVEVSRTAYPQLADHVIEDDVVVPVVLAAEWLLRAMRRQHPDATGFVVSDLRVLSGIVLDDFDRGDPTRLRVLQSTVGVASEEVTRLELASDSTGRVHYRGDLQVVDGDTFDASTTSAFVDRLGRFVTEIDDVYSGGVLFHGPSFQVLRDVLRHENGLSARCLTGDQTGWDLEGWESDPAVLDGALQLALVWTHERLAKRSLPTAIGALRTARVRTPSSEVAETLWTMTLIERRSTDHMVVCDVVISCEGDVMAVIEEIVTHVLS